MKGPLKEAGRVLSSGWLRNLSDGGLFRLSADPHSSDRFSSPRSKTLIVRSIFLIDPYPLTFPLVGVLMHPFSRPQPKPNPSEENPRLVS